jgi:hypothetical protein
MIDISNPSPLSNFSTQFTNEEISPRFKDLKSAGASFLSSERNSRLLGHTSLNKLNSNYETGDNKLSSLVSLSNSIFSNNLHETFLKTSNSHWATPETTSRVINNTVSAPLSHTPLQNTNASIYSKSFDKFLPNEDDLTPNLLKSKEESAPNHIFNTY